MDQNQNIVVNYENIELFRDNCSILKDLNIKIHSSEFVYLIGKVGSGKSTFLKSLYGEVHLGKGHGTILDFDLNNIKKKEIPFLRRSVGIVFQDFQLLIDRSVYKNLEFVLKATGWKNQDLIDNRITEVLTQVGMQNKGYKMPHELSGGEQQRIVIARALLNAPKLILADEPTGNLDPETGLQIIKLLYDIAANGTTVIISTHNYAIIKKFNGRILKCDNGIIKEVLLAPLSTNTNSTPK